MMRRMSLEVRTFKRNFQKTGAMRNVVDFAAGLHNILCTYEMEVGRVVYKALESFYSGKGVPYLNQLLKDKEKEL